MEKKIVSVLSTQEVGICFVVVCFFFFWEGKYIFFWFADPHYDGLHDKFEVPGSTPADFKKLILEPGEKTEREVTLERSSKVLESYQNAFLAVSVFVTQITNCCRKMNQNYRDIFYGCKSSCPIHCVHDKVQKVRPGKFKKWPKKAGGGASAK